MKTGIIPSLLLTASLFTSSLTNLQATELITNGDFSSFEKWETSESQAAQELVDSNSPFVETYPNNGKAAKLTGKINKRTGHLSQAITQQSTGRLKFQIDLRLPASESDGAVTGWNILLFNEASQKNGVAGFSVSSRFRLRDEKGMGGKILLHKKTSPGEWLHFTGVLDFSTRKWSGSLRTENGAVETFTDLPFLAEGTQTATVAGVSILSMSPSVEPTPLIVDNISLISEAPQQESEPSIEKP